MLSRNTIIGIGGVALTLAALAGCAPADKAPTVPPSASASGAVCPAGALPTKTSGKLTIGTDNPVYSPWFSDNKPANGQGFESAVAFKVAETLGYAPANVTWTSVTFSNAIAPGPKAFDFDINEFSITPERQKAVDFSSPYYQVRQAVITTKSSKIAGAKSIADLKAAKLGAQVGTTSFKAITDVIQPSTQPQVFNNNDDAKAALANGTIDGLVVDLPTAFHITSAQLKNGVIVGQLPKAGGGEQFGLVLDKGSALTSCVSKAVDQLNQAGTLTQLEKTWLASSGGAPELS